MTGKLTEAMKRFTDAMNEVKQPKQRSMVTHAYVEFSEFQSKPGASSKLTAQEESLLDRAHRILDWWKDVVDIGETLVSADPMTLTESVRQEVAQYISNRPEILNIGETAYETVGVLSAKKYETGRA